MSMENGKNAAPQLWPPRPVAGPRDLRYAAGYFLASLLAADGLIWYGPNLALSATMLALLVLTACYLRPRRRKISAFGTLCAIGAVAAAVSLVWTADGGVKCLALLLGLLLATLALRDALSLQRRRGIGALADAFGLAWFGITHWGAACYGLFHRQGPDGSVEKRRVGSILLGLLCAGPVLAVLVVLLALSDAAFDGVLQRINAALVLELLLDAGLGTALFLTLFGQSFCLPEQHAAGQALPSPAHRGIETAALAAFLGVICGLYVCYLVSQLAYFFSGFAGLLPADYTAAEYARRGFFEMAAISAINLALTGAALQLARRQAGRLPGVLRGMLAFLSLFSLLLIATAASKLALYIASFGMTRLRVLTALFLLLLAVCFVCVLLRLFLPRFSYGKPLLAATALVILLLSFGNVDGVIARYNLNQWQRGQLTQIDVAALGELNEAAVPTLWTLAQDDAHPKQQRQARAYLTSWGLRLLEGPQVDSPEDAPHRYRPRLRAYNRTTARAARLIEAHWAEIYLPGWCDVIASGTA